VLGRQRAEATALPNWVKPQLAKLVDQPPDGPEWLHEIKFDGYRMHARLDRGVARLLTRTGIDCASTDRRHRRCRGPARSVTLPNGSSGSPGTSEPISFPFIDSTRRVHVAADRGLPRRRDRGCAAAGISGATGSGSSREALRPRPRPICFARLERCSE